MLNLSCAVFTYKAAPVLTQSSNSQQDLKIQTLATNGKLLPTKVRFDLKSRPLFFP